jgi:hypothetical protein
MKKAFKKLIKTAGAQWFFGFLIAVYSSLVWWTSKVKIQNSHIPQKYWDKNKPVVIALGHGRLALMPFLFPRKLKVSALISDHPDGRLVKNAAWFFNIRTVVGSSTRGGVKALREILRRVKKGETIFITPDGPKGPYMTCSKGTIEIARMGGIPIIPASISAQKGKNMRSWDKFLFPKPFNTLIIRFDDPIEIPEGADKVLRERIRTEVERTMQNLQAATDNDTGFIS